MALYPDVAPFADNSFDCCDLLQRSVIHHGDTTAPIEDKMTRECDERMWNLAYRLAQSGEYRNYQGIEWELRAFGYPQAPQLLCRERVRERLDSMCAEARKGFVSAC